MYDSYEYEPEGHIDETPCWYEWVTLLLVFVLVWSAIAAAAFRALRFFGVEPTELLHSISRWLS